MTTTRRLNGRAKTRYLQSLLAMAPAPTDPLLGRADAEIAEIVVTRAAAGRLASARRIQAPKSAAAPPPLVAQSSASSPPPALAETRDAPAFDPYAFSAMAVLLSEGQIALLKRLAQVKTRAQMLQLAQAQSVRLEPALVADQKTSMAQLRAAFVAAVEKRVCHRRAVTG